eukprot:7083968-Heterocapsa_arctica.AAC.1
MTQEACRLAGSSASVSRDPVLGMMIVEVPVPTIQNGIVHAPTIMQQERITHQQAEELDEVPVPTTQEE